MNLGGMTDGLRFTSGGGISNFFALPSSVGYTYTFPAATGTIALTSDISYPVTSVFGRTGAVVATSGDYTTTQVTEGTNLYFTDARSRAAISLTTTGTSGASTYNNTTGVLNIPQYQGVLTNPVTGTGTTNTLPKFTGSSTIGDSAITDNGTTVTLVSRALSGTTANFSGKVGINATIAAWMSAYSAMQIGSLTAIWNSDVNFSGYGNNLYYDGSQYRYLTSTLASKFELGLGYFTWAGSPTGTAGDVATITEFMRLNASGNLGINTLAAIGSRLQVNGNVAIGYTSSTTAPTNGLAVSGNTLIGTTTDNGSKFQVSGTSTFSSSITANSTGGVSGSFISNTFFGSIDLENTGGAVAGKWNLQSVSGAQVGLASGSTFGIYSYTASAYRLIINSTGQTTISATDSTGNRFNPFNVLTITANNPNLPYDFFGGAILFRNQSYTNGVVDSVRIRSAIYDNGSNLGGGFVFEVTPTAGGTLTAAFTLAYNGVATFSNLAGTGSRAVLASVTGVLSAPVSDISVKQNIISIGYGLNEIVKMNPVWFNFIDEYKDYGEGRQNGNIAQEMELIIPEAVFVTPSTGKMGINYDQLHAVYIKAIQELKLEIEELKALINK
jgi:hypothetical protein